MTNRTYKVMLSIPLLLSLLFVTGCPGQEQQPQQKPESQQKINIGVSLASMEFDGNQTIKKVMEERAKKDKVKLIWTDAKMDPAQQEKDVDKLIKQKVKAIILQTADPKEGAKLVDKIVQAKIKVIGLETMPLNAPLDGYVAADHVRAGELQGKYVLMQMNGTAQQGSQEGSSSSNQSSGGQQEQSSGGGQGGQQQQQQQQSLVAKNNVKVLILKGDPSDPVSALIAQGAQDVLKQSKNIEQIQTQDHPQGDPNMAQMTVQNILKAGTVDAILAIDDRMANAAIKALKAENLDKQVVTVGVGADQKITQALSKGDHDAEIDIMPEQLANFALDAALDLSDKGNWNYDTRIQNGNYDIPSKIIPVRLIEKDQVHLLEARWEGQKQEEGQQQQSGEQQGSQGGESQQGGSEGGSQEGSQQGQGGSSQGGQGGQGEQSKKTKVKIVTQDGKVMEVEVDGEIQKIEQNGGGGEQGQQGGGGGGQQGGGQGGGQ